MTYILLIFVKSNFEKLVGNLGRLRFEIGYYAYVGSAKSNFLQRIKRHLSKKKKLFWHIDYLLVENDVVVEKVFFTKKTIEHKIAKRLYESCFDVLKKFGSSDCDCPGHLFRVTNVKRFEEEVGKMRLLNLQGF
jgi:sugar fermentation stimulation protein A